MDKTCPSLVIFSERWYEKIWPFARANSWQKRSQMLWLLLYYLTEMTRLGGQSVVRVEEISKKRNYGTIHSNLWRVHPRERWQTALYSAAKKRLDCTKTWSTRMRHLWTWVFSFLFFFYPDSCGRSFKSSLESGFKTMRFRWIESISCGKKKHLRLQKYPDSCEPGLRHTVETVDCQQSLGIIARVCMLNASERGKRAREKTEREGGSLFFFVSVPVLS